MKKLDKLFIDRFDHYSLNKIDKDKDFFMPAIDTEAWKTIVSALRHYIISYPSKYDEVFLIVFSLYDIKPPSTCYQCKSKTDSLIRYLKSTPKKPLT